MIEFRSIREQEGDTFLALLCTVFGLDFGRARSVFYGEPYFDLNRKWAGFVDGQMVSVLTTTPLQFGWGSAIGIAGVGTLPEHRSEGIAARLIEHVMLDSPDESAAMLFARDPRLYSRIGFEVADEVVKFPLPVSDAFEDLPPVPFDQVRSNYEQWASTSPTRLVRDDKRWEYWHWHHRVCAPLGDGYFVSEPSVLREAALSTPIPQLPLPEGTEWYGTRRVAESLRIEQGIAEVDLLLMTRNFPNVPEMFMTDQF